MGILDQMATTPGRRTALVLDPYTFTVSRPSWTMRRTAEQIRRTNWPVQQTLFSYSDPSTPKPHDVVLVPGGAWILNPLRGGSVNLTQTFYNSAILPLPDESSGNVAPGIKKVPLHRPSTLLNMDPSASMATEAAGFRKTVPLDSVVAGDWSAGNLAGDQSSYASPAPFTIPMYPMDRAVHFEADLPENVGLGLVFAVASGWWGTDGVINLFMGGNASLVPAPGYSTPGRGGSFCVQLRGDGKGTLFEGSGANSGGPIPPSDPLQWVGRLDFRWSDPGRIPNTIHTIQAIPHGYDRMLIVSRISETAFSPGTFPLLAAVFSRPGDPTQSLFVDTPNQTGHQHVLSMTGHGTVRLDIRRDMRTPIALYELRYPHEAYLYDAPFRIPFPLPAGTGITLALGDSWQQLGSSIEPALFSAVDNTPCPLLAPRLYGSLPNVQDYYAGFHFLAGTVGSHTDCETPVLYAYTVSVPGQRIKVPIAETQPILASIENLSIVGPGQDPETESASFTLRDLVNEAPQLTFRDKIPAEVRVINPTTGATLFKLFEGETIRPTADYRAKVGRDFPGGDYKVFEPLRLVGRWGRLADQVSLGLMNFNDDPQIPPGSPRQPWKVTDIIRWLLQQAQVPDAEIDVSDSAMRLWSSPDLATDDYTLQPGLPFTQYLHTFCRYLGRYLVRDPNAGASGMWRLLQAQPSSRVLQTFHFQAPPANGPPHVGWAEGHTFVRRYQTYTKPPEFNGLIVTATGQLFPDQNARGQLACIWLNYAAVNWNPDHPTADPTSPDYTDGEAKIAIISDASLRSIEAVRSVCAIEVKYAGHGQKCARWTSPLIPVTNPDDPLQTYPRPLGINDLVYFADNTTYVRVAIGNPIYTRDDHQMIDLEGMILAGAPAGIPEPWMSVMSDERKALRGAVGRSVGENTDRERVWANQVKGAGVPTDLLSLPASGPGQMVSLTVDDPANPNFGKTLFVPGVNTPGDGTVFG